MKKLILFLLIVSILFSCFGCTLGESGKGEKEEAASPVLLSENGWDEDVKTALNDLLILYGNTSENYDPHSYAVFDFDNTTAVFDVSEQFMAYQLDRMCFGFTPSEFCEVFSEGLSDLDADLSAYGYGNGSYNDWLIDLESAYTYLFETYGPFSPQGIAEESAKAMREDPLWLDFSVKFRALYDLITDVDTADVSYPWTTYWFYGFTEQELYDVSYRSHVYYENRDTESFSLTTDKDVKSKVGVVSCRYTTGVSVTPNNKELWRALEQNGIDVWVCSASHVEVVCAAIDAYGLHDAVSGVIGMTDVIDEDGKITNAYDFETGYARYAKADGTWQKGDVPTATQTQAYGKVKAIDNILVSAYGCGPIAGFGDSSGDFNFCTEYEDMKLALTYNRANRKVTDGGGLLAAIAVYQKDTLKCDLATANARGDTLYLLQGRDENGTRSFRNSRQTVRLGESEPALFRDAQNEAQLQYIVDHGMTVKSAIDTFALKTAEDDEENPLGFAYGFLEEYQGYHNR